ncbi:protein PAIR1 isoform X2 [Carica papaya]|uniref:protein PAIR1 isoform X2 n=1 Tax=Carica papaya TaxID=3649 RepID=UPI000B8C8E70|nr:protein PAIR1 isoform X2 [Carica papaya]
MKLKINKACDLSSISVLPPHTRRRSSIPSNGPQSSQLRSQPSQQSFSQGISSHHGTFSQLTQNSLDEAMMNDQRFGSQEREKSLKKVPCLPSVNYTREESPMPISRSSANVMFKWNSASVADHKCQIYEELERRIGAMETSLNRYGIILDSVQSDVMQVNRGTKEILMETESIRQKLILHDTLLQLLNKGQEDTKASLEAGIKSVSDQLSKDAYQERLQQIFLLLSAIPEQMGTSLRKLQNELCSTFIRDMQAIAKLKIPDKSGPIANILPAKVTGGQTAQTKITPQQHNLAKRPLDSARTILSPKVEVGSWRSVKLERATCRKRPPYKEQKLKDVSSIEQESICRVIIDSDGEIDAGFSCLLEEKGGDAGNNYIEEAKEETRRILRKARRIKRKYSNPIIIN